MDTDGFPGVAWRPLGREHIRKVAKGRYRIPGIQHGAGLVGRGLFRARVLVGPTLGPPLHLVNFDSWLFLSYLFIIIHEHLENKRHSNPIHILSIYRFTAVEGGQGCALLDYTYSHSHPPYSIHGPRLLFWHLRRDSSERR
jgi:hypothetical protein